jgi:hypothetical protein
MITRKKEKNKSLKWPRMNYFLSGLCLGVLFFTFFLSQPAKASSVEEFIWYDHITVPEFPPAGSTNFGREYIISNFYPEEDNIDGVYVVSVFAGVSSVYLCKGSADDDPVNHACGNGNIDVGLLSLDQCDNEEDIEKFSGMPFGGDYHLCKYTFSETKTLVPEDPYYLEVNPVDTGYYWDADYPLAICGAMFNGDYKYCDGSSAYSFAAFSGFNPTLPNPDDQVPLHFLPNLSAPINYSYGAPYSYWTSVFTSPTDWVAVWQCAGVNYEVPNCNDLTFIGSSTVWNFWDKQAGTPSGNGTFILSATSSAYRTYKAVSNSSLFSGNFDPVYFSVNFGSTTFDGLPFSLGEDKYTYWCDNPCYDLATSTLLGWLACAPRELFCWAFQSSTSSSGYVSNSFLKLKSSFPFNAYFDITNALTGIATTTTAEKGFKLPMIGVGGDGKATITMETFITASTTKKVIGENNYTNIRQGIVWFLWIVFAGYVIARLSHKHI